MSDLFDRLTEAAPAIAAALDGTWTIRTMWPGEPLSFTPEAFTGCLRGCPGLQAGEESDPCGAGQGRGFAAKAKDRAVSGI